MDLGGPKLPTERGRRLALRVPEGEWGDPGRAGPGRCRDKEGSGRERVR